MQRMLSVAQTLLPLFPLTSYCIFSLLLSQVCSFRTLPFCFSLMSGSASTATGALWGRADLRGVSVNVAKAL